LLEQLQQLANVRVPETFLLFEGQLEEAGLQVGGEEEEVVRVDETLLAGSELRKYSGWRTMNWSSELDASENADRAGSPPRAAELLPRGRDRSRVADQDRGLQASDVDASSSALVLTTLVISPLRRPASISRR
jgi:hypothetical protein